MGAFEKKPKKKQDTNKNVDSTQQAQPQVVVQKVIEYRDKPNSAAPATAKTENQNKKDTESDADDSGTTTNETSKTENQESETNSEAQTESKTLGQISTTSLPKNKIIKQKLSSYSDDDIAEVLNTYSPRKENILDQIANFGSLTQTQNQLRPALVQAPKQVNKEDGFLKQKLLQIKNDHSKELDSNQIDEIFHSFSHLNEDSEQREINLEGAENAQQELFRKWEIYLSDSEQTQLDKDYFVPSFKLALNDGRRTIDVEKAEDVVRGMFPSSSQEN